MTLLAAQNLRKMYAGRTVVNGVSFEVGRAEIVGLLGRNGAGKTTSFRIAIGMIEADAGRVLFDGHDVSALPMYRRARRGMGYLSQEPSVFSRLTVEQNLLAILETLPLGRAERRRRAAELLEQFGLTHKARQQARTCSGGERRKLEIARALVTSPKLILLDEPFSGVDPIAVEDLQAEIARLAERGIASLITDHNVQQTLRVCHRAYIIDEGRKFAEGTPRDLINDEMVRRVYLGSMFRGDEFDGVPTALRATASSPIVLPRSHAIVPHAGDRAPGATNGAPRVHGVRAPTLGPAGRAPTLGTETPPPSRAGSNGAGPSASPADPAA